MGTLWWREWGAGDRTAVLIHGITNDSSTWYRVGPELAARGYRVLAIDLPGHGRSPRLAHYGHPEMAGLIADTIADALPAPPELALGHSFGGLLLSLAVSTIDPTRAVYLDPVWAPIVTPGVRRELTEQATWTLEQVAADEPRHPPEAHSEKLGALRRWDTATFDGFVGYPGHTPEPADRPSLVLAADTSGYISPERAADLRARGFEVRTVAGTGHIVHHDDHDGFLAAVADWL